MENLLNVPAALPNNLALSPLVTESEDTSDIRDWDASGDLSRLRSSHISTDDTGFDRPWDPTADWLVSCQLNPGTDFVTAGGLAKGVEEHVGSSIHDVSLGTSIGADRQEVGPSFVVQPLANRHLDASRGYIWSASLTCPGLTLGC